MASVDLSFSPEFSGFDNLPDIPPRSRLFSLQPKDIGTSTVEGLDSYIIRLSAAHSVSPRRLIRTQFVGAVPEISKLLSAAFFRRNARTINGHGAYANLFVQATIALTGVGDLEQLTLLPLTNLLPPNGEGLIARTVRWCPECLAEIARNTPKEIYRPLSWSFLHYRACTQHRCLLCDRCPHCGSYQEIFPKYPSMAHCTRCGMWLGGTGKSPGARLSDNLWISSAIEDVILHLKELKSAGAIENFARCIVQLVNRTEYGSHQAFCKGVGLIPAISAEWVSGHKPSFSHWLAIAYGIQVHPAQLFLAPETALQSGRPLQQFPIELQRKRQRPYLSERTRREIAATLAEIASDPDDCQALSAIARQFDRDPAYLRRYWPAPCALIQAKYRHVRRLKAEQLKNRNLVILESVVKGLVEQGKYPGGGKVNKELKRHGMALAQPELKKAYRELIARWPDELI